MRKKVEHEEKAELEIVKAVAQAWHGRSGSTRPAREFDAHRSHYRGKPSRFKLEVMNRMAKEYGATWDFSESLWDSYEIVTVSKRLEAGLAFDNPVPDSQHSSHHERRRRESKNSLRSLFSRGSSSKRFDAEI